MTFKNTIDYKLPTAGHYCFWIIIGHAAISRIELTSGIVVIGIVNPILAYIVAFEVSD